jgi:hypothetical protein
LAIESVGLSSAFEACVRRILCFDEFFENNQNFHFLLAEPVQTYSGPWGETAKKAPLVDIFF